MRKLMAFALVCAAVIPVLAQDKNPVTSAVREILPRQQKNIVAAAEEMPADKFSYKPTADQMSFGKVVVHIAGANNTFCGKLGGAAPPKGPELKETDAKDKLIAAMKSSFDFCGTALGKVDDSKLAEKVELFGHEGTVAWALIALASSWSDHYGMEAMYLRLNGLLPPTAKKK